MLVRVIEDNRMFLPSFQLGAEVEVTETIGFRMIDKGWAEAVIDGESAEEEADSQDEASPPKRRRGRPRKRKKADV